MKITTAFTSLLALAASASAAAGSFHAVTGGSDPKWQEAVEQARGLVAKLTLEEKIIAVTGMGWEAGKCVGDIAPIPSINFTGLCLNDSPTGLRWTDRASAFPASMNVATTWDKRLMFLHGVAMGREFRGKGAHIALAPMMNLARAPEAGRAWEGQGADPYVTSVSSAEQIKGIQSQGVMACAKHYILNEVEHFRRNSSSNVDDRAFHEVWLAPFRASVEAGVLSIMCSYNMVNNTQACGNKYIIDEVLKGELGFQGFVMTDWFATYDGLNVSLAGTDMMMPGDAVEPTKKNYPNVAPYTFGGKGSFWWKNLTSLVESGEVPIDLLDDKVTRILAAWIRADQHNDFPETNLHVWDPKLSKHVPVSQGHDALIREVGAASTVLLKNNGSLPLTPEKGTSIALIGSGAGPGTHWPGYYRSHAGYEGNLAQGWGSGTSNFPYLISPLHGIIDRAKKDIIDVRWSFDDWDTEAAIAVAGLADTAIVFVSSNSGEAHLNVDGNQGDRNNLTLWKNGAELIKAVADHHPNVVVVVNAVGPVDMLPWAEHENVTAILWAGLPGQESGNALADVLFGDVNPSGRLPYTINRRREDYPAALDYTNPSFPDALQINYTESLLLDYRWNDAKNIAPLYPFGHGLSYTKFQYLNPDGGNPTPDTIAVNFDIKNIGEYDGHEVAQLYISYPEHTGEPPKVLKGFEKVFIKKNETENVEFVFGRRDLEIWSVEKQKWVVEKGTYYLWVGASSRVFAFRAPFFIEEGNPILTPEEGGAKEKVVVQGEGEEVPNVVESKEGLGDVPVVEKEEGVLEKEEKARDEL
ncbi:hypothetical protein HDV00_002024 [Rhizophlyctis rosea]|nr:hypothetical protein HDV00_002024 [Rhizophlyctis rosea]